MGLNLKDIKEAYFIAEIGSNFDGSLKRAKELIKLAKECGSQAVKFQNYTANSLVSDKGFKSQEKAKNLTHQANWKQSVFDTYDKASLNSEWMFELAQSAKENEIDFLTSPYSIDLVEKVNKYCDSLKIGSGDITFHEIIKYASQKNKPLLIATGASSLNEVIEVMSLEELKNKDIVLMQCNTSYKGDPEEDKFQNINVLKTYKNHFPNVTLGLSCHSPSNIPVIAAVTLGAKVIEKHFTDDCNREGPDHKFALDPNRWVKMISEIRSLERILGDGEKKLEKNEVDTVVVQRRGLYWAKNLKTGEKITSNCIAPLRPCPKEAISAKFFKDLIGKKIIKEVIHGDMIKKSEIDFY